MQNVDPDEIKKFEQIAANWWDKEGDFKPLHQLNTIRVNYILEHSQGLFHKDIVDIGCGGGILTESLAKEEAKVLGIDMGLEPLTVARLHALENGLKIDYKQITAESLAEENPEQFDIVTCMEMLEHVPTPQSVITACSRLLKPGGHLFVSTINRNIKSWLTVIIAAERLLKLIPKGTHDINKCIRPSELIQWLEQASLSPQRIDGVNYNPFTGKCTLTKKLDTNYMIHARKLP